jgi:hypothetical protein
MTLENAGKGKTVAHLEAIDLFDADLGEVRFHLQLSGRAGRPP